MKILHFIWCLNIGGAETMLIDICNAQSKEADVFIVVGNTEVDESVIRAISSNVKLIRLNRQSGSRNPFSVLKLNWIVNKINPDIVHCHHQSAARALRFFSGKKVLTDHGTIDKNILDYKKYDRIFAISEAVKKNISISSSDIKPVVVLNGIDFSRIKSKITTRKPISRIVQVGGLEHKIKGQDILLKALNILLSQQVVQHLKVDFIGSGSSHDYLIKLSNDLGIQDHVNFLGSQNRNYVYDHLCDYDLLVQPSRYEGFGLTIIEGMAAKIPVLVSNIEGPMEVIREGAFGYAFRNNNPIHTAEVIKNIADVYGSSKFNERIEQAYQYAKANFDIQITVANYFEEYRKVLESYANVSA